jgi:hypothetical protein
MRSDGSITKYIYTVIVYIEEGYHFYNVNQRCIDGVMVVMGWN